MAIELNEVWLLTKETGAVAKVYDAGEDGATSDEWIVQPTYAASESVGDDVCPDTEKQSTAEKVVKQVFYTIEYEPYLQDTRGYKISSVKLDMVLQDKLEACHEALMTVPAR